MNTKFVLTLLLLVISFSLSAQELTLELSKHPNKEAVIVAEHGVRKDTIGIILLNQNGKGSIVFKNKQAQTSKLSPYQHLHCFLLLLSFPHVPLIYDLLDQLHSPNV